MNILLNLPATLTYLQWQIVFSIVGGILILLLVLWIFWRSHKKSREREQYFSTIFGSGPSMQSNAIQEEEILIESVGDIFDDVLSAPRISKVVEEKNTLFPDEDSVSTRENKEPCLAILYVLASDKQAFDPKDLIETLHGAHLTYGDMNIFHRHTPSFESGALFSVASATEPGYFDLQNMHMTPCKGLCFFADLSLSEDPQTTLNLMLQTAEQIAHTLNGKLHDQKRMQWDEAALNRYYDLLKY